MSDFKISALPAGTPLAGDEFVTQRGGTANYRVTSQMNTAGRVYSTNGTIYPVGTLTDTQYLQVIGGSVISSAVSNEFGITYVIAGPAGSTLYPPVECPYAGSIQSVRLNSGTVKGNEIGRAHV
jgi:hypothetical protein